MVSASQKGAIYLIIGLLGLGTGIGVAVFTLGEGLTSGRIYFAWISSIVGGSVLIFIGIILCCIGQDSAIGPA